MNDQPEIEDFGKLEGKMKCEVTNFAIQNKNSSYEVPFYRSVTPHRRKRCGAFEKEGLICTDGKGFGSCKGKTSQCTPNDLKFLRNWTIQVFEI